MGDTLDFRVMGSSCTMLWATLEDRTGGKQKQTGKREDVKYRSTNVIFKLSIKVRERNGGWKRKMDLCPWLQNAPLYPFALKCPVIFWPPFKL